MPKEVAIHSTRSSEFETILLESLQVTSPAATPVTVDDPFYVMVIFASGPSAECIGFVADTSLSHKMN